MKKLLYTFLVITIIFFSCKEDNKTKNKPSVNKNKNITDNICGVEADFFLTTEELEIEFNEDKKRAHKKYHNKIIELTACYFNGGTSGLKQLIQIGSSSDVIFMEFSEDTTINLTKNGMEVKVTGWNAIDDYMKSLPKCSEYSLRTMETGEGVGDITIKGVLRYNQQLDDISFVNCCINLM